MAHKPTDQEVDETQEAIAVFQKAIRAALDEAKSEVPFSDAAMCGMVLALLRQAIDIVISSRVLLAKPDDIAEYLRGMDLKQAEKLSIGLLKDCWKDKADARKRRLDG